MVKELPVAGKRAFGRYRRVIGRYSVPFLVKWTIQWGLRILTSRLRILPDFIIIGAQRCGTTSLYSYLLEHPSVIPAFKKETLFFSNHFGKGVTWYRCHFPLAWHKHYVRRIRRQDFITGEASPYYIFHPHVPRRISETVPQARLIALLRNPVDRAYSHYHHEVKMGLETLPFEDAIEREEERLSMERAKMLEDENYRSFNYQNYSYLSRGIYVDQLENWTRFFDRDQILVLKSEDFNDDPVATLEQIAEFIDLPKWELNEYKKYHYAHYPEMDAAIRKRLTTYFEPHNQRLYEFLGVDLGWES
ncbi:MAG: sulfotransferase [Anaerolineae bacterium]|nr:sulfotransferase [Anaerolineae bacterium]